MSFLNQTSSLFIVLCKYGHKSRVRSDRNGSFHSITKLSWVAQPYQANGQDLLKASFSPAKVKF